MEFGIAFANVATLGDAEHAVGCARAAEAAGFESLWTVEHPLVPVEYQSEYPYSPTGKMPGGSHFPLPDPLVWLAYVAAATETIKLATGILIVPLRNPAILAKEVATLDHLSGGRVLLGVGAGWLEEEFDALDVPFADRGKRLEAYLRAMRVLWTEGDTVVDDPPFVSFGPSVSLPKPVGGTVPIHVGGHSEVAARRAGRLGDGFFPGRGEIADLANLMEVARQTAEDHGRDPGALELTVSGADLFGDDPMGTLEALTEIGVDRVMVPPLAFDAAGAPAAYEAFADRVIRPWRERA